MDEKKNIGSLFNRIAPNYDKFNHLLSFNIDRRWRRQAVSSVPYCHDTLDVATGTADLALEIFRQHKTDSLLGVDLSSEMMSIGQEKVAKAGLSDKISFRLADCAALDLPDCSFDLVSCAYGVRNFAELDKSLSEMFRVLRPGGQLLILEFSYPSNGIIRFFYNLYFSALAPLLGSMLGNNRKDYDYLPRSVKNFIWGEDFLSHLRQAGFSETKFKTQTFGISTIYTAVKH